MYPYGPVGGGGAASTPSNDRTRSLVLAFGAFVATFFVLSLSAHHNAPSSPSAQRVANYLPSLSLSNPSSSDYSLDYRQSLEASTSPPSYLTHSPLLTFDHIYVLSLPSRQDRRETMQKLANALGITIEFVDALDKHEPVFEWIAERVAETRKLRKQIISKARKVPPSSIGGISIGGDWSTPYPNPSDPSTLFPPYPPPTSSSPLRKQLASTHSTNWVQHLEFLDSQSKLSSLKPSKPNVNVNKLLWDPLEKIDKRQITKGIMSTWFGQTRVMKRSVERGDQTALVLEDDVDFEWDLEKFWKSIERRLPKDRKGKDDWDITYLGHCWGGENQKPQYLHPLLHPSTGPMCLHAYALTLSGAKNLLTHLSSPWQAYQSAIDLAVPSLLHFNLLKSYSITPPLVIQRKDGPSDLQGGNGSKWRGLLRDSTHERVLRDEGEWHEGWEDTWSEGNVDPATVLRCGPVT